MLYTCVVCEEIGDILHGLWEDRDGPLNRILCDIDTALHCVSNVDYGSVRIDLI